MAAQFTSTNGFPARGDMRWSARATSSFPTPLSPRITRLVRESWLLEDRWWTPRPLRRRYWEVVTDSGRDLVVLAPGQAWQGDWALRALTR